MDRIALVSAMALLRRLCAASSSTSIEAMSSSMVAMTAAPFESVK
jgi:hypothetical protein